MTGGLPALISVNLTHEFVKNVCACVQVTVPEGFATNTDLQPMYLPIHSLSVLLCVGFGFGFGCAGEFGMLGLGLGQI